MRKKRPKKTIKLSIECAVSYFSYDKKKLDREAEKQIRQGIRDHLDELGYINLRVEPIERDPFLHDEDFYLEPFYRPHHDDSTQSVKFKIKVKK